MARRSGKGVGKPKAARRKARKRAALLDTRRREIFTYQGYTIEELQEMSLEELMPLLPARARRSLRRGPTVQQEKLLEKLKKTDGVVRTHRRDMVILPSFVGRKIAVHHGNGFKEITIVPEMIGCFLGEFALTRKQVSHSGVGVGATRSSKFMPLK
jgi:small subunit ribosomal protein S19